MMRWLTCIGLHCCWTRWAGEEVLQDVRRGSYSDNVLIRDSNQCRKNRVSLIRTSGTVGTRNGSKERGESVV